MNNFLRVILPLALIAVHRVKAQPPTGENCYYCSQAVRWAAQLLSYNGAVTGQDPNFPITVADLTCSPFNDDYNCVEIAKNIAHTTYRFGGYRHNPCDIVGGPLCDLSGELPPPWDLAVGGVCLGCEICGIAGYDFCDKMTVPPCLQCHAMMGCPKPPMEQHCGCPSLMCIWPFNENVPGCCD